MTAHTESIRQALEDLRYGHPAILANLGVVLAANPDLAAAFREARPALIGLFREWEAAGHVLPGDEQDPLRRPGAAPDPAPGEPAGRGRGVEP